MFQVRMVRGELVDEAGSSALEWIGLIRAARNAQEQTLEAVADLPGGQVHPARPAPLPSPPPRFADRVPLLPPRRSSTGRCATCSPARSSPCGTPTPWRSGSTSRSPPPPRTTRKVRDALPGPHVHGGGGWVRGNPPGAACRHGDFQPLRTNPGCRFPKGDPW